MKKTIQFIFKCILLVITACLLMTYFSIVLRPKYYEAPDDMTNKTEGFYALEKKSLDVLFLGSSHSYYAFNPAILWKKTGAYSYVFAGECQPFSQTYYYLKQAIKTQTPQVIVLDVFGLLESSKACQTDGIYKKNSEGLRNEIYRAQSLKEISDKSLKLDYLLDLRLYHSRWNEMTLNDFKFPFEKHFNPFFGWTMGYPESDKKIERDTYYQTETVKPDEINLQYLDKIIDLCRKKHLPLLLVKTPFYVTQQEYNMLQYIKQYTQSKGIQFIDFNDLYEEMNFHFDQDGDIWHTNIRGSTKLMNKLIEVLKRDYHLSTSKPKKIESYEAALDQLYNDTMEKLLQSVDDIYNYFDYIQESGFTFAISYNGTNGRSLIGEYENQMLNNAGIHFDFINNKDKDFIMVTQNDQVLFYEEDNSLVKEYKSKNASIKFENNNIIINGKQETSEDPGLKIVIIDTQGRVLDSLYIDYSMVFWLENR